MGFRYLSLPGTVSGLTQINTHKVSALRDITVGSDRFELTSVVVLNPLLNNQLATGCSSMVIARGPTGPNRYYYYNPLTAGTMVWNPSKGEYECNDPVSRIKEFSADPESPGFNDMAEAYGTILVYVNPAENK
jgi:hypothetical protein